MAVEEDLPSSPKEETGEDGFIIQGDPDGIQRTDRRMEIPYRDPIHGHPEFLHMWIKYRGGGDTDATNPQRTIETEEEDDEKAE